VIRPGPFQELNLCDYLRAQPQCRMLDYAA
jgi:hypothetical protein